MSTSEGDHPGQPPQEGIGAAGQGPAAPPPPAATPAPAVPPPPVAAPPPGTPAHLEVTVTSEATKDATVYLPESSYSEENNPPAPRVVLSRHVNGKARQVLVTTTAKRAQGGNVAGVAPAVFHGLGGTGGGSVACDCRAANSWDRVRLSPGGLSAATGAVLAFAGAVATGIDSVVSKGAAGTTLIVLTAILAVNFGSSLMTLQQALAKI